MRLHCPGRFEEDHWELHTYKDRFSMRGTSNKNDIQSSNLYLNHTLHHAIPRNSKVVNEEISILYVYIMRSNRITLKLPTGMDDLNCILCSTYAN